MGATIFRFLAAGLLLLACGIRTAFPAASWPAPPCRGEPSPVYAAFDAPPLITIWRDRELQRGGWRAPRCTGWDNSTRSRLVVALAGRFSFAGDSDALLARAGAISSLRGVRYWSTREQVWRPLVLEASALASPDAAGKAGPRGDFTAAELADGRPRHYRVHDSRSGQVLYRLRVLERSPSRLVVAQENASAVRNFGTTLFEPGALQTLVFLDHEAGKVWRLYLLTRMDREGSSFLARGHEASVANRAMALFRHLAGIPTDQEPPALR